MKRSRAWLLPTLAAIAVLGAGIAASEKDLAFALARQAAAAPPSEESLAAAEHLSAAFTHVAETIAPSVVTIRSTREVDAPPVLQGAPGRFFFRSPLEEFFGGRPFPPLDEGFRMPGRRRLQLGEGSGVIVSGDGYILTNSHVVEDASEVTVVLDDDREYTAKVVGTDPKTDVAVIRIDADGLEAARIGDSDGLRVGQWVVAAGSPFGLTSSITTGIVSATGRSRMGIVDYEDFIQTDAAINRGNSGGPLVNLRGEVIGLNTAVMSRTGDNVGIGFAIPINMAKEVMDELIQDGRVVRGYLGVLIQDLSGGMARSFGYDGTDGALVSEVTEDGPAGKAGLRPGDIITHFDGKRVTDVASLRLEVAAVDPGTKVEMKVFRDGTRKTLDVRIGELPVEVARMSTTEGSDLNVGMTVETLTPSLAERYGLDRGLSGVLVTAVEPAGPAGRAGLRQGDVITHVQDEAIDDAGELRRELRAHDLGEGVRLTIRSGASRRFVFLQLRD